MSDLDRAIARARREISAGETPIRRALARAYREAVDALQGDLEAVTRMIADARKAGVDLSPDWLRRQARYQELLRQAEYQFARFATEGERILAAGQVRAVSGGAHAAMELTEAVGLSPATVGFGAAINVPAVERLVASLLPGSPVRDVLNRYGPFAASVIERELVAGMIEGAGPREVVRTIRREIGGGATRARLDALVRTEYMRSFRGSLFQTYSQLGVTHWVWTASLSARTCLACLSMSGRRFPMTETFMPAHISCRCVPTPDSPYVTYQRGEDWFASQDADVQRRMMPSGDAYTAYRDGRLPLSAFVGHKRSSVWGSSITERSGRAAMRAAGVR